jgi:hypothetical protein
VADEHPWTIQGMKFHPPRQSRCRQGMEVLVHDLNSLMSLMQFRHCHFEPQSFLIVGASLCYHEKVLSSIHDSSLRPEELLTPLSFLQTAFIEYLMS